MGKIKTRKAVAKRFKVTGGGKVKRSKAFKNHILNKKSGKTIRGLRKAGYVSEAEEKNIKKMIPYQ